MQPENGTTVKCPLCGHSPCEVQSVSADPRVEGPASNQTPRKTIHARCPKCGVQFQRTTVAK